MQDTYPDELNQCFGCGARNPHGLQLKSYWSGDELEATFVPKPHHMAAPGFVYGGLIASLIDCHGTATAAAIAKRAAERDHRDSSQVRYVTASLEVHYVKPTPLGPPLRLLARARTTHRRRMVVAVELSVDGVLTAHGEVVAVQVPRTMLERCSLEPEMPSEDESG